MICLRLACAVLLWSGCTRSNLGVEDPDLSGGPPGGDDMAPPGPDLSCALEVCGDGVDNNCNTQIDEGCQGLGTFVSNTGNDNNPGTQAMPLATITKGIANAVKIGAPEVFVAGGHYSEKVKLTEGVSLLGGYQCDAQSCTWARDAMTIDTAILNVDAEGLFADNKVTRKTKVEGFRVAGAGATGGITAAITLDGATATIVNNRIAGGAATGGGITMSVRLIGPSNEGQGALVSSNQITGGTAADQSYAVHMSARPATPPAATVAVIQYNTITGGAARATAGVALWTSSAGTRIFANRIQAGASTVGGGASFGVSVGGRVDIDRNLINTDQSGVATCAGANTCGGIQSFSATATITNNVVFGMAASRSFAVWLQEAEMPAGQVILNGNYLDGSGPTLVTGIGSTSAAIALRIGACNTCGFNGIFGRVRNNVLAGGRGQTRIGILEEQVPQKTNRPELVENNDFTFAPAVGRNDVLYRAWSGTLATDYTAIDKVNMMTAPPAAANISADPMLDATFHLQSGSPCVDQGSKSEAPANDMDGEARPKGNTIDIGPDESK